MRLIALKKCNKIRQKLILPKFKSWPKIIQLFLISLEAFSNVGERPLAQHENMLRQRNEQDYIEKNNLLNFINTFMNLYQ